MGYLLEIPMNQICEWDSLWVIGDYGFSQVWVIAVLTVEGQCKFGKWVCKVGGWGKEV